MIFLLQIIKFFVRIICFITYPFKGKSFSRRFNTESDDVKFTFSAIADIHLQDKKVRRRTLALGLEDMKSSERPLDAVVFAGDNTDHGYKEQYDAFNSILKTHKDSAKDFVVAMGNHDTWDDNAKKYFLDSVNAVSNFSVDKPYYSVVLNGYKIIVMATEERHVCAKFSQEQLDWLKDELLSVPENKPVFVVCHWSVNQTHGLPDTWDEKVKSPFDGGIGEDSDKVQEILSLRKNVVYINGHIHLGLTGEKTAKRYGRCSFERYGNFVSFNLPSFMYLDLLHLRGRKMNGTGLIFEVYDDRIVVRSRNFLENIWYNHYRYEIPIE